MPIEATVSGRPQITANVSETQIDVSVSGGFGPSGPSGVTSISGASDVSILETSNGDVLRYSNGKWRNYPELNLVDGGNW